MKKEKGKWGKKKEEKQRQVSINLKRKKNIRINKKAMVLGTYRGLSGNRMDVMGG